MGTDRGRLRVLLATTGTLGDVIPFIGIGMALNRRGYQVTLIANSAYESQARIAGLEFASTGPSDELERALADPDLWDWRKCVPASARAFVVPNIAPVYQRVAELFQPSKTLLVATGPTLGARIAQEQLGIPMATIFLQPSSLRSVYDTPVYFGSRSNQPWLFGRFGKRVAYFLADTALFDRHFGPAVNSFRSTLGLPPVRRVTDQWWMSPQRVIGLWPEWYAPPQPDWPAQTAVTGFLSPDGKPAEDDLDRALQFGEDSSPPILYTAGTGMVHGHRFFSVATEACQLMNRRGLLLTRYREQVPANLPASVRHFEYLPFRELFPRCAALVHHGGIGTAAEALAAGIPQVIMPMAFDQFDNAARLARLGISKTIFPLFFRPRRLAKCLKSLLESDEVSVCCRRWKAQFAPEAWMQRTCDLIEELAHS